MAKSEISANPNEIHADRVYISEYIHCLVFFICLFCVFAVASFDPTDNSSFSFAVVRSGMRDAQAANFFGPWGAALAEYSYQLFGVGSVVFGCIFLAQALASFREPKQKTRFALRIFGYPQLVVCYLGLTCLLKPEWKVSGSIFYTGGLVGHYIAGVFAGFFGNWGGRTALFFGVVASLPLCLGMRPVALISKFAGFAPLGRLGLLIEEMRSDDSEKVGISKANNSNFFRRNEEASESETELRNENNVVTFKSSNSGLPRDLSLEDQVMSRVQLRNDHKMEPKNAILNLPQVEQRVVGASEFKELLNMLDSHQLAAKDFEAESGRLTVESAMLEEKLSTFGVTGKVLKSQPGPVVNVHEFEPAPGIKVTKVLSLQDDLALGLKAQSIMMAPQSGKSTIGIEVPAQKREVVSLRDVMEQSNFRSNGAPLPMALGKLVDGSPLIADLSSMPHLLVAGSTGSGKSVGINTMLLSMIMSRTPKQLRLILVDPKMLELSNYDGIGHLLMPVVTEPSKAAGALKWAINEMERRYRMMKMVQVRNVAGYNAAVEAGEAPLASDGETIIHHILPYIVVVIDELCDLMMTAPKDVEDSIQRLSQMARAAGIHLILATQRPSVDVLTGVIKANLPCRLSFQVASKHDSRTIIETVGAERLLGKGDMLFLPPGTSKLVRAHGAYVADKEINSIIDRLKTIYPENYASEVMEEVDRVSQGIGQKSDSSKNDGNEIDGNAMDENALYEKAVEFAIASGSVSTSSIQRNYRIGYNRAARIMDRMVKEGLVGPSDVAGKPRAIIAPGASR